MVILQFRGTRMKPAMRIKDNSRFNKSLIDDAPHLTSRIVNKTLKQLESEGVFIFPDTVKIAKDISDEQIVLQSLNDQFLTSNIMGFIGLGDERLIIGSRFSEKNNDFFLQYLIEKVFDLPNIVDLTTDANQHNQLFNFLLFLFPYYLKSAMRKGLFKRYICNAYNDENVRGRIDIARHITQNTPFLGKVAYSQREFSYDNYLTELIRHTIEFIKKKPLGAKLLVKVKDEVKLIVESTSSFDQYERQKIIELNKKRVIKHAYFHEYFALQRLCLLIIQNRNHQIGTGSRQIYGILFDGAWLWEEYINLIIGDLFYHPMNKCKSGPQHLFDGKKGQIFPDFISKNRERRIIADAKYKPILNISNKDYLQLLAYMFRFDSNLGLYIYPETEEKNHVSLYLNRGVEYENNVMRRDDIRLIKLGLKIPNSAPNYQSFLKMIQINEQNFKTIFLHTLRCSVS